MFTVGNGGALLAALATPRMARGRIGIAIVGGIALFVLGTLIQALSTPGTALFALAGGLFLTGVGAMAYNINQVGLRQGITPHAMQGRMNATMRLLVWGTIPFGSILGGLAGGRLGLRTTLWVATAVAVLALLPIVRSPVPGFRNSDTCRS